MKAIDHSGRTFGNLKVVKRDPNKGSRAMWLCQCACGTTRTVESSKLVSGHTKSCGCLVTVPMLGKRFGRLLVIESATPPSHDPSHRYWLCRCDCGNTKVLGGSSLRQRVTRSCGCLLAETIRKRRKDLTGERRGRLTVLGRDPNSNPKLRIVWLCRCDCGNEMSCPTVVLKKRTSCGCALQDYFQSIRGKGHPLWQGGRITTTGGYVALKNHEHPNAWPNGYVFEHIAVMSAHLGRAIRKNETVHHKNGIKTDNRLENLELWASVHQKGQRVTDLVEFARSILRQYDADAKLLSGD